MKARSLIVYLIVFAALGLFYWLYEVKMGREEQALQEVRDKIYVLDYGAVDQVKLKVKGVEFEAVMYAPDKWKLVKPVETLGDRWEIEGMVRQILEARKDREFAEPVKDLAEYGLAEPAISLSLYGRGKLLAPSLHLGEVNPAGFLSYAKLGDTTRVFLLIPSIRSALEKSLYDLRDRSLLLVEGQDVERIFLKAVDEVELKRTGIRSWEIVRPSPGKADPDVVQKMLYDGLKSRALEFVDPANEGPRADNNRYGLETPLVRVRVATKDGKESELKIGLPSDAPNPNDPAGRIVRGYWAKGSDHPEVLLADVEAFELLNLTHKDLIDRHVFELDQSLIDEIAVEAGDRRLRAKYVNEMWDVLEPGKPLSDPGRISSFLKYLADLRFAADEGVENAGLESLDLNHPDLQVKILGLEISHRLDVFFGPVKERYMAVRADEGPVLLIERLAFLNALPAEIRPNLPKAGLEEGGR